jgi:hypothetical protein
MEYPSFCWSDYQSFGFTTDSEQTINLYFERPEAPGATSRGVLYPTPGVEEIVVSTSTQGRAHFFMDGREFAVISNIFYEVGQFGTLTFRGAVTLGPNPATISSNGDGGGQLFITSGENGYIYDLTTHVFTQIAGLTGKASMGDQIDGYFLALDANTSTLYISNLLDGLTWDPTQFAQRSKAPDRWVGMKVNGSFIWLLGTQTSEPWYNTGASPFPFAPYPGVLIPYGCAAPFTMSTADGVLLWLGASKIGDAYVLKASGLTAEVISNYPLQVALNGYGTISDAIAYTYNDMGHTFFILTFPRENVTHCWDAQSGQWTQRLTWISEESKYVAWRPRWPAVAFGEHRILDGETGAIYRMSSLIKTDVDSRPIRRVRRAPALESENADLFFPGLELQVDRGQGLVTGQGEIPLWSMRMSNDYGRTWGNEHFVSAGKLGEFGARIRWNRLGSGRGRVFEVAFTDPCFVKLVGAFLTPDPYPLRQAPQQQGAA